jgi:hypothetical protein
MPLPIRVAVLAITLTGDIPLETSNPKIRDGFELLIGLLFVAGLLAVGLWFGVTWSTSYAKEQEEQARKKTLWKATRLPRVYEEVKFVKEAGFKLLSRQKEFLYQRNGADFQLASRPLAPSKEKDEWITSGAVFEACPDTDRIWVSDVDMKPIDASADFPVYPYKVKCKDRNLYVEGWVRSDLLERPFNDEYQRLIEGP